MDKPMNNMGLILLLILLIPLTAVSQDIVLNVDNQLIKTFTPADGKSIVYKVDEKKNNCIQLFGANPAKTAKILDLGDNKMDLNAKSEVLCVAKLQNVQNTTDGRRYVFSKTCGERFKANANVKVVFAAFKSDKGLAKTRMNSTFRLGINTSDIFVADNNKSPTGATNNKNYLLVQASKSTPAKISINEDKNRGRCLVAIIEPGASGRTLGILDPKSKDKLSFFVDQPVYVIPIVEATVNSGGLPSELIYEVGDPRRNGKIVVEEI